MEVSLSFAALAVKDNIRLLLLTTDIVALALILARETTATFVLACLHKSQPAAVEMVASEK